MKGISFKVVSILSQDFCFDEQDWLQFFCNLNSPKNYTCLSGKLRTKFTRLIAKYTSPQNAKKVSFTACHSGKLQLACISRRVVLIVLKFFFWWAGFITIFLKKIHLPVGQVKNREFTSLIAKSTSPKQSDNCRLYRSSKLHF